MKGKKQFDWIEEESRDILQSGEGISTHLSYPIEARAEFEFVELAMMENLADVKYFTYKGKSSIFLPSDSLEKMIYVPKSILKRDAELKKKAEYNGINILRAYPQRADLHTIIPQAK